MMSFHHGLLYSYLDSFATPDGGPLCFAYLSCIVLRKFGSRFPANALSCSVRFMFETGEESLHPTSDDKINPNNKNLNIFIEYLP